MIPRASLGQAAAASSLLVLLALAPLACPMAPDPSPPPEPSRSPGGLPAAPPPAADALPALRLAVAFPRLRFERPVLLTHAGDGSGRLFVVEQGGRIHVFPGRPEADRTQVFLDLRASVRTAHDEEGLLALAFHPDYARNRAFFVHYSASAPKRGVLARYRTSADDPDRAEPTSEEVLLEVEKPYGNHNGATLLFGPDRYLYLSLGDGGAAGDPHGNGQSLATLLGKILRLDVDRAEGRRRYALPADNPFLGRRGARGEIWAYGLRNVWRMSFDRATGELWAGDVGQDAWEEIDLIRKGGNYGWSLREGAHAFRRGAPPADPLLEPVTAYGRDQGGCVIGGHVYRGARLPRLVGAYVYADYLSGRVWALRRRAGRVTARREVARSKESISSFGEGPDGELYLLAFDGRIYRLEEEAPALR